MKLLLDQNISPRIVTSLKSIYPEISHVREHRLQSVDDEMVWKFARTNGYIIVSKDSDFRQRSFLFGWPPKVIWLRVGNCSTKEIEKILRANLEEIQQFSTNKETAFLAIP